MLVAVEKLAVDQKCSGIQLIPCHHLYWPDSHKILFNFCYWTHELWHIILIKVYHSQNQSDSQIRWKKIETSFLFLFHVQKICIFFSFALHTKEESVPSWIVRASSYLSDFLCFSAVCIVFFFVDANWFFFLITEKCCGKFIWATAKILNAKRKKRQQQQQQQQRTGEEKK